LVADGDWTDRHQVFFWGTGRQHGLAARLLLGGQFENQRARQVVDACHGDSHSSAPRPHGLRQTAALNDSSPEIFRPMISHAALNASLNGISGVLLACGYWAIRTGKRETHKRFMVSAFTVSCTFLISYLVYHYRVGSVPFQGQGWIRPFYFALLISHTILA